MNEPFTPNIKRVATPAKSSDATIRRGKKLMKEKQFDEALEVFEELVKNDQGDAFVHTTIARIKYKHKDMDSALDHFQIAIKMDPSQPQAYIRSARIYFAQGELARAKEALSNAIRVQPKSPIAHVGMGAILQREKKPEAAIEYFQTALSFNPRLEFARKRLAQALSAAGRVPDAMTQVDAALRIKPDDPEAYAIKGRLHLREKQYDDAQRAYEQAVELGGDGGKTQIRVGLAEAYIQGGKQAQAEQVLRSLPQRDQSPLVHKLWGDLYTGMGMHREALEEYRAASLAIDEDLGVEGLQDLDLLLDDGDDEKWEAIAGEAKAAAANVIEERRRA